MRSPVCGSGRGSLASAPVVGSVWNAGAADAVMVSWAFFERVLGSDASRLGQRVAIDGVPRQIVGVMPRHFVAPFSPQVDVWLPLNRQALLADTARARRTVSVTAPRDDLVGPSRTALFGVGAAAALLMLIVWANIAGLTAAQAAAFRRAHAVRFALGATSGDC